MFCRTFSTATFEITIFFRCFSERSYFVSLEILAVYLKFKYQVNTKLKKWGISHTNFYLFYIFLRGWISKMACLYDWFLFINRSLNINFHICNFKNDELTYKLSSPVQHSWGKNTLYKRNFCANFRASSSTGLSCGRNFQTNFHPLFNHLRGCILKKYILIAT